MATRTRSNFWFTALAALALACATAGCELVADFDRDKIPEPPRDASFDEDASFGNPSRDAGKDAAPSDDDGGETSDEDAGR